VQQCRAPLPFFGGSGHGGRTARSRPPLRGNEKAAGDAAARGDGAALLRVACAGLLSTCEYTQSCQALCAKHGRNDRIDGIMLSIRLR
jgi:hypothetical protein